MQQIMKRVLFQTGQFLFLSGIVVDAVYTFFKGDFAMTSPRPYPEFVLRLNPEMAYISGSMLLLAVVAFAFRSLRMYSLITIAATIFLFATTRHIMLLWRDSINSYKSLWIIAGALLLLSTYPPCQKYFKQILFANIIIPFVYFLDCGLTHFKVTEVVTSMIPEYIPFRTFFAYFTGLTLILAGIGLLIPKLRRLTVALSAIQIFGWLVLLHFYRALNDGGDQWTGVGETLSFTGICILLYYFFSINDKKVDEPNGVTT